MYGHCLLIHLSPSTMWSTSTSQFPLHSNQKSMILLSATQSSTAIDCLQNWYTSSSSSSLSLVFYYHHHHDIFKLVQLQLYEFICPQIVTEPGSLSCSTVVVAAITLQCIVFAYLFIYYRIYCDNFEVLYIENLNRYYLLLSDTLICLTKVEWSENLSVTCLITLSGCSCFSFVNTLI